MVPTWADDDLRGSRRAIRLLVMASDLEVHQVELRAEVELGGEAQGGVVVGGVRRMGRVILGRGSAR